MKPVKPMEPIKIRQRIVGSSVLGTGADARTHDAGAGEAARDTWPAAAPSTPAVQNPPDPRAPAARDDCMVCPVCGYSHCE